jgi:hypothetical protein
MSIQSEINRLKQAVSDACAAISNKGGTVPSSKVSGNLATAINSIPSGITVQSVSGTFTTDQEGVAVVDCGLVPDFVTIDRGVRQYHSCAPLKYNEGYANVPLWTDGSDVCYLYDLIVEETSTGFSAEVHTWDARWYEGIAKNTTFNYTAIKYT